MSANWVPSPSYVIQGLSKPRGLIPELLAHMLQESCGTCYSYKTWNISYTVNTTESIKEPDIRFKVDFRFPVRSAIGKTSYRGFHPYVPLINVPGVALMTRKKTPSGYARDVGHSVLAGWPIFAVSIVLAVLIGVVIWFAVSDLRGRVLLMQHESIRVAYVTAGVPPDARMLPNKRTLLHQLLLNSPFQRCFV